MSSSRDFPQRRSGARITTRGAQFHALTASVAPIHTTTATDPGELGGGGGAAGPSRGGLRTGVEARSSVVSGGPGWWSVCRGAPADTLSAFVALLRRRGMGRGGVCGRGWGWYRAVLTEPVRTYRV